MRKKLWVLLTAGFISGIIVFIGLRVILVKNKDVHYHANFGLFVNGKRDKFSNFSYYEEIAACSDSEINSPKHAAHMHENVYDLVHVHAHAATWGGFFSNLGYTLGNKVLATDDGVFVSGSDGKKLQFLLNGQPVDTVQDRVIQDKDALLISFGDEDSAGLQSQYKQIAHTAAAQDAEQDPAACSGADKLTLIDRFKKAFDFTE